MKQIDFGNNKITRNIFRIAVPMLLAELLNLLYSVVDRIYIGRIPGNGTQALGGIGLCFPVIIIITGFSNMYGMGGSPLFSIELGRGNKEKAQKILNTSFCLLVITAVAITILGELFARPILILFGANDTSLLYSLPYLRIYLIGSLFSMIAAGLNPFINAQGFPTVAMASVVTGAVANLVLDPCFIFVFHLGVKGAAIATVISQGLAALITIIFWRKKNNRMRIDLRMIQKEKKKLPYALDIISLGTASFIMSCTNSLVQISCNSVLVRYGGELYVSVMTIILSVRQILDTPVLAFTNGTSPIISFNYGSGKPENIKKIIWIMSAITVSYTMAVWLLILFIPEMFISIFTSNRELIKLAVPALHLYFFAFVFQALQYSGQSVFKALNIKKYTIFFSLLRKIIMVVPLTYLLPSLFHLGTKGVFIAEPVSNVIGGLACFITMLIVVMGKLKNIQNKTADSRNE